MKTGESLAQAVQDRSDQRLEEALDELRFLEQVDQLSVFHTLKDEYGILVFWDAKFNTLRFLLDSSHDPIMTMVLQTEEVPTVLKLAADLASALRGGKTTSVKLLDALLLGGEMDLIRQVNKDHPLMHLGVAVLLNPFGISLRCSVQEGADPLIVFLQTKKRLLRKPIEEYLVSVYVDQGGNLRLNYGW